MPRGTVLDLNEASESLRWVAFSDRTLYTPAWTAASVNPAIGNGSLAGWFSFNHRMCELTIYLTFGSSTTHGTGAWYFALPVPFHGLGRCVGTAVALDSSVPLRHFGACRVGYTGAVLDAEFANGLMIPDTASHIPFEAAQDDTFVFSITYPVSAE